jgi:pimeloyl-ACP methyl ester carboxylesterase
MNTVVTEGRVAAGGAALSRFIEALRSTDQRTPAHITAIGHSYGSTTVAHGGADAGLDVDDLILVGSPGAGGGITRATQLGLPSSHVWVGRNSRDPVTYLGTSGAIGMSTIAGLGLGQNPADEDFGANRFQAEAIDRGATPSFGDHVKYFEKESESLHNIGAIVAGTYSEVESAQPSFDRWYAFPVDPEAIREPGIFPGFTDGDE